eukprot:2073643-Amphidinium_carterae.2
MSLRSFSRDGACNFTGRLRWPTTCPALEKPACLREPIPSPFLWVGVDTLAAIPFFGSGQFHQQEGAHFGRAFGASCTLFPLWDVGCSLQCDPGAVMRKYSRQLCCHLKAWRTGDAGNASCFTIWLNSLTRITTLGSTLRRVLVYRTSPSASVWINLVPEGAGRRIVPT